MSVTHFPVTWDQVFKNMMMMVTCCLFCLLLLTAQHSWDISMYFRCRVQMQWLTYLLTVAVW